MKMCPYCFEEINEYAIICANCKRELPEPDEFQAVSERRLEKEWLNVIKQLSTHDQYELLKIAHLKIESTNKKMSILLDEIDNFPLEVQDNIYGEIYQLLDRWRERFP